MEEIKDLLKKQIKTAGLQKQIEAAEIVERYKTIISHMLGRTILDQAQPFSFKDSTLTVVCIGSSVMQELKLHEVEILKKLNTSEREMRVSRIRYTL